MKLKNEIDNLRHLLRDLSNEENCVLGLTILASIDFKTTNQLSQAIWWAKRWLKTYPYKYWIPKCAAESYFKVWHKRSLFKYGYIAAKCSSLLYDYKNHETCSARRQFRRYYSRHRKEAYEKEGLTTRN